MQALAEKKSGGKKRIKAVRLTLLPEEKAILMKAAKKLGLEVAVYVRLAALEKAAKD